MAEALKVNSSIANIGLAANSIGDEGAKAWRALGFGAEHLPTCKTAKKMPGLRRLLRGFWGAQIVAGPCSNTTFVNMRVSARKGDKNNPAGTSIFVCMVQFASRWTSGCFRVQLAHAFAVDGDDCPPLLFAAPIYSSSVDSGSPLQKAFPKPCLAPSSIHFPAGEDGEGCKVELVVAIMK